MLLDYIYVNLKKITLTDKDLFDTYFLKFPQELSEMTFASLYTWNECLYCEKDNHLFIVYYKDTILHIYPPIGENTQNIIINLISTITNNVKLVGIGEKLYSTIINLNTKENTVNLKTTLDRDQFDYIYSVKNLMDLSLPCLGCFRRHVEQCQRNNTIKVIEIKTQKDIEECRNLNDEWINSKQLKKEETDYMALDCTLTNYIKLDLIGYIFSINGKVEGFRIGEHLNNTTYVSHFAKNNTKIKGLGEFMIHAIVSKLPNNIRYLNLEQDLGLIGLRKHKLMMKPIKLLQKWNVYI
jgi:hypothetical protein